MARLFGVFTYASGPVLPVLRLAGERLRIPSSQNRHGYGVGYAHGGDVLLQRRPQTVGQSVDLAQMAGEIRSNAFVAHVRRAEVGGLKFENTQPFRFGPWLFAQVGTLPGGEAVYDAARALLPDSISRNLAGETDAEAFFHLFLARLADEGISPRQWAVEPAQVSRILGQTLTAWRLLCSPEVRETPPAIAAIVTNGQSFFVLRTTPNLWLLAVRQTPRDFEPLPLQLGPGGGSMALGVPTSVLVVDGESGPEGAIEVPANTVLCLDRDFRLIWHPAEL